MTIEVLYCRADGTQELVTKQVPDEEVADEILPEAAEGETA